MFKINILENLLKKTFNIVNKVYNILFLYTKKRFYVNLLILSLLNSCNNWIQVNEEVVARIGTSYLYKKDIVDIIKSPISKSDSLLKINTFIDNWARKELLLKQAKIILPESVLIKLETMVQDYRDDLFTNLYRKAVLNKNLDTILNSNEINMFLNNNKEIFKLKAPLFKVRYIHLPPYNVDKDKIKLSFQRFNSDDRIFLDSLSYQYNTYLLSDSLWINKNNLISKVSFLNQNNFDKYIKKSKFYNFQDTLGVYLFFTKDLLDEGELAPNEIITSKIKNIILNKRKQELIKQFEKDILQDAIKSKTFEKY